MALRKLTPGHCRQLGATPEGHGTNFAIWGRLAKSMELLLFSSEKDEHPEIITLAEEIYRSGYYWHVHVGGVSAGQLYAWRVKEVLIDLPGNRFDPQKVLLDPYGRRILLGETYNRQRSAQQGSNLHCCAKNIVVDMHHYDWEDDAFPRHPLSRSVIYEMHVGGFTKDPSSGLPDYLRGTYAGVTHKIPYLQELGVTAVELLPVFQFDPQDARPGKSNYWGYSPMGFFAPHAEYAADGSHLGVINEFRNMVKALHKAHIEVILDVVYNHTAEGGDDGPVICFRGVDNDAFYTLDENFHSTNYSGCGNTLDASHPMTKKMITDSLKFWREEMHIDGFRFDLAAILSRDGFGQPMSDPPTIRTIDGDYSLADTKLFAEAWDAGGLYLVGKMAGDRWREWNGRFRDDVRRFIKGDDGMVSAFATRLIGSPDIYHPQYSDPYKSLNFITCHDGFTLWDLLSFNQKHNELNGENNQDGTNDNYSWNHGTEGQTSDPAINALRLQQAKNLLLVNLMSVGTPMIQMGDEVLRTQRGNNNVYCQDNAISWLNWHPNLHGKEMLRFVTELMRYRSVLKEEPRFFFSLAQSLEYANISWHGTQPFQPDWSSNSHAIGLTTYDTGHEVDVYAFFNAWWQPLSIILPPPPHSQNSHWKRVCDTGLAPPHDITPLGCEYTELPDLNYNVQPRSVVVLVCHKNKKAAPKGRKEHPQIKR